MDNDLQDRLAALDAAILVSIRQGDFAKAADLARAATALETYLRERADRLERQELPTQE